MLSTEECRVKLGQTSQQMSDSEVEKLRNELYALISQLLDNHTDKTVSLCKKQ